ncbi:MAG: TRAP transporter substrate-binding protein [Paracoccus sp. (in: a-proteobacteria)]
MKTASRMQAGAALLALTCLTPLAANAQTTLRIQTPHAESSPTGELIVQFVDDIETMSGRDIDIEMYYSNALVDTGGAFDAAVNGVLDCDMTNASFLTGKDPAFQFAADLMGGYDTPLQQLSWLYFGGGREALNQLYGESGMTFVGWHTGGQESLVSTKPVAGLDDLKEFKFRSPPGMESEIFSKLGAKPVVMDFSEIFTALETGIIDGADASYLSTNKSLGLYDIAKHTTYPGFHSMSADHLACNSDVWNGMTDAQRRIIDTAMQKLSLQVAMRTELANGEVTEQLLADGVKLYDWSAEDRAAFREAVRGIWDEWATKTPMAKMLVDSHRAYLMRIGLLEK